MPKPNILEEVLKDINHNKIQLQDDLIKMNNKTLRTVMDDFCTELRKDDLFNALFREHFFGGSFYDNLKVGKPDEFDIDFIFHLPANASAEIMCDNNYPGYVQVELATLDKLQKVSYPPKYKDMKKLVNEKNYLSIEKIMSWFQGLVIKANNALVARGNNPYKITKIQNGLGPAVTFQIRDAIENTTFDVDFVPCFVFSRRSWPKNCKPYDVYKPNEQLLDEFLVVPKPKDRFSTTYFRLSFQGQERDIITGSDKGHLKPAIKLIKFLRDQYSDTRIKSYYIKTVAIWALRKGYLRYKNESLSSTFLQLLKLYIDCLREGSIDYYWNSKLNLLENCSQMYRTDLANRLAMHYNVCLQQKNEDSIRKIFKVIQKNDCITGGFEVSNKLVNDDQDVAELETKLQGMSSGEVIGIAIGAGAIIAGISGLIYYGATRLQQNRNNRN